MTSTRLRTILLLASAVPLLPERLEKAPRASGNSQAADLRLSPEQAEVWNEEQNYFRYLQAKDLKKYMSLWDDRFVGWPDYLEHPARKQDIEEYVAQDFRNSRPTIRSASVPKPEAIAVFGDVAVTYYFWPETAETSPARYRMTHTWRKGPAGWRIIGGMSCPLSPSSVGQ